MGRVSYYDSMEKRYQTFEERVTPLPERIRDDRVRVHNNLPGKEDMIRWARENPIKLGIYPRSELSALKVVDSTKSNALNQ